MSEFSTPGFDKKGKVNDLESSRDDESSWFDKSVVTSEHIKSFKNQIKDKSTFGGNDTFGRAEDSIEVSM